MTHADPLRHILHAALVTWPLGFTTLQAQGSPRIVVSGDTVIDASTGRRWAPDLYDIRYIATLQEPGGTPFLLLHAVGCLECDAPHLLYVLIFGQAIVWTRGSRPLMFAYGPEGEPGDDPIADARAFFGDCLGDDTPAIVGFLRWRRPPQGAADSIKVATIGMDTIHVQRRPWDDRLSAVVERQVTAHRCTEFRLRQGMEPPN